ncbi:MAG TPA: NADH-quinone oxidoreductase subunit A [Candidatus Bathyarchaeia archaeon]|nr:NADH-quinone oxidoreductase subunit A [Candidatus Bathyarchaeia archaeon]
MTGPLWPFVLYAAGVLVVAGGMIGLSYFLGQRHRERATVEPYESGVPATASARLLFSPRYYVVAMLFVVFDVETAFLVVWAVALRPAGWRGFAGAFVFVAVLVAVLAYEWRAGAFDFALKGKDVLRELRRRARAEGEER